MLEPIFIDLSDVANEFVLSEDEIKSLSRFVLASVSDSYVREWEKLIDDNLHSTRTEYKKGIFQEQTDDYSVVIGLTPRQSQLAMMIEDGASSFDEKEGFKKSDKRVQKLKVDKKGVLVRDSEGKTQDGGWYLTIPFRWATADALGESGIFANKMPKPIEKLVKVSKDPLKFDDLPASFQKKGMNKTSSYNHKFTIYEGLQRVETGSGNEKRGGYMSFRRVSENSDTGSWVHPGFVASNFMERAFEQTDVMSTVDFAIDEFLSNR